MMKVTPLSPISDEPKRKHTRPLPLLFLSHSPFLCFMGALIPLFYLSSSLSLQPIMNSLTVFERASIRPFRGRYLGCLHFPCGVANLAFLLVDSCATCPPGTRKIQADFFFTKEDMLAHTCIITYPTRLSLFQAGIAFLANRIITFCS